MLKTHGHLSDDRLIALCLDGADAREAAHCPACQQRFAAFAALLADVHVTAVADAEAAFPAERLERQRARILQRLEQDGRPGRLIAFPRHARDGQTWRSRPDTRWVAAAAAAGLVIGLLAGHATQNVPGRAIATAVTTDTAPPGFRAVPTAFSEDEFLGQVEMAADSPGGTDLRSLHDLTPRAWEVR